MFKYNDPNFILHRSLVMKLLKKGEKFYKRHGNWIRYNMYDDIWLIMDSWNEKIELVKGIPLHDGYFFDKKTYKRISFLSGNFGEFILNDLTMLKWANAHL